MLQSQHSVEFSEKSGSLSSIETSLSCTAADVRKLHLAEKIVQKLCAGHSQPESQGAQKNCAKIVREPHFLRNNCVKVVRAQLSHNFGES